VRYREAEQQMLAIGRALMTNPSYHPGRSDRGLAPLIRDDIWRCLTALKRAGQSILVIDKNVDALIETRNRHYIIERDRVTCGPGRRASSPRLPMSASVSGDLSNMTLADDGFLEIGPSRLEYQMTGPRPDEGATFVLLHEGLGRSALGRVSDAPCGRDRSWSVRLLALRLRRLQPFGIAAACDLHARGGARCAARVLGRHRVYAAAFLLGTSDGASIATSTRAA